MELSGRRADGRCVRQFGRSIVGLCVSLFLWVGLGACSPEEQAVDVERARTVAIPERLATGESLFTANCARCHGERALGTDVGPPLVDIVYEPSHHADVAFQLAVSRGVRSHHWSFGDMMPLPNVTPDEVERIVAYVRFLQQAAGIE